MASEASSHDANVNERLARLESLMAAMLSKKDGGEIDSSPTQNDILPGPSPKPTQSPSKYIQSLTKSISSKSPVGHIYFQDGYCIYFDSDFWASLIGEVSTPCLQNVRSVLEYSHWIR